MSRRFLAPLPPDISSRQSDSSVPAALNSRLSSTSTRDDTRTSSAALRPPPVHPSRSTSSVNLQAASPASSIRSRSAVSLAPPRPPSPLLTSGHHTDAANEIPVPTLIVPSAPPAPPPAPPRVNSNISIQSDWNRDDFEDERDLSEAELRRMYDDEELQRYLTLFASRVMEVSLPMQANADNNGMMMSPEGFDDATMVSDTVLQDRGEDDTNEGPWVQVERFTSSPPPSLSGAPGSSVPPNKAPPKCLSELVMSYIVPLLPPPHPDLGPSKFSLTGLRISIQRLYLIMYPVYVPAALHMWRLATWRDWWKSAGYCALYWLLWLKALLLPAFVLFIGGTLVWRRFRPYPTVEQLRERRRAVARADALGTAIDSSLAGLSGSFAPTGGDLGVRDAWRIFRGMTRNVKKTKIEAIAEIVSDTNAKESEEEKRLEKEEKDWRVALVTLSDEIADFHERVKNIFLWRRPAASRLYALQIFAIFIATLVLPAHIMSRIVYFLIGFAYWFIVPCVLAIDPENRPYLPPFLGLAPTDAEYAIEVISQRIERGESVVPQKQPRRQRIRNYVRRRTATASSSSTDLREDLREDRDRDRDRDPFESEFGDAVAGSDKGNGDGKGKGKSKMGKLGAAVEYVSNSSKDVDWQKWTSRAVRGKEWIDEQRQKLRPDGGDGIEQRERGMSARQASQSTASLASQPDWGDLRQDSSRPQVFPAQLSTTSGVITLTASTLTFSSLFSSQTPRLVISLDDVRGVRKVGRLGGICIRYIDAGASAGASPGPGASSVSLGTSGKGTKDARFKWVGGRDELFARLVGWGGRKWVVGNRPIK
ncbi:hypothetical protein BOTBODRAFT_186396 [Botryobasidium botryosum FD-172 SS1]|uniref:GRAM domain-containing protein n=1 Tax=Botryobasidium botryosum (strain FD-172 SS1) TaxID=930990 RepID=A0A067MLY5_BOTB1|nr:hypothetical protein BOTBODRAFT_186396 [Botryobasidium botryosum FD-172 SS1]